jgi:hypothetical protein
MARVVRQGHSSGAGSSPAAPAGGAYPGGDLGFVDWDEPYLYPPSDGRSVSTGSEPDVASPHDPAAGYADSSPEWPAAGRPPPIKVESGVNVGGG